MAKLPLPSMKIAPFTAPATPPTEPVIIAPAVDPDAEEDAQRDRSVVTAEGETVEGMTSEVVTSTKQLREVEAAKAQAQPTETQPAPQDNMPRWGTPVQPLSPRLAADDIAKLEELSRTMLEIRSIAIAAQTMAQQTLSKHNDLHGNVVASMEAQHNLQNTVSSNVPALITRCDKLDAVVADEHTHSLEIADEVAMLRHRLDAVDTMLASRGLPTTAQAAQKPTLKLHAKRRLVYEAKLDGDAVVIYYNPRQGHDGHDEQEYSLSKDNIRNVWTGYAVEVPASYVCDVFIDADVICSKTGRDDAEFMLKAVTRGPRRLVAAGGEVCRLTLRRIEAMRLEVVK